MGGAGVSGDLVNLREAWSRAAEAHNEAVGAAVILARELGEGHSATRRARNLVADAATLVKVTRRLAMGRAT